MSNTSQTTGGSTEGSTGGSSRGSTARQPSTLWTKEEVLKIQMEDIRDLFYIANRRGEVDEFLAEHFPNRTKQAVWQKVWQIEKRKAKFCKECGSRIKN